MKTMKIIDSDKCAASGIETLMSIMRSNDPHACQGVSLRGYRRGENCGAIAKYDARGKRYCSSHYVVALKEPSRFRDAMEAWVRGEARREASRRAVAAAQIDAFEEVVS